MRHPEAGGDTSIGHEVAIRLLRNVEQVVVGKKTETALVMAALLSGGHVLLEDVPGTAKTILARVIAQSIEGALAKARAALGMAAPILQMSIPRQGELSALIRSLKESVDELLLATRQDGTPAYRHASRKRVMQQAEQQILRERAWFRASGFELAASQLPSIDDVLLPNRNES